jgi:hypothetical protein
MCRKVVRFVLVLKCKRNVVATTLSRKVDWNQMTLVLSSESTAKIRF